MKVIFRWVQISSSRTGISLSVGAIQNENKNMVLHCSGAVPPLAPLVPLASVASTTLPTLSASVCLSVETTVSFFFQLSDHTSFWIYRSYLFPNDNEAKKLFLLILVACMNYSVSMTAFYRSYLFLKHNEAKEFFLCGDENELFSFKSTFLSIEAPENS